MMGVSMTRHTHLFESFLSEFAATSDEMQPVLRESELRHMGTLIFFFLSFFPRKIINFIPPFFENFRS